MSLNDIRTAITAIINTVPNVGKVFNGIVFLQSQIDLDTISKNGIINAIGFIEITKTPETEEDFMLEDNTRRFGFVYYFQHNNIPSTDLTKNTFITVETFAENLMNKFNLNETLNGTVSGHTKLRLTSNNLVTAFNNKFVHLLTFELETYENFEQNEFN